MSAILPSDRLKRNRKENAESAFCRKALYVRLCMSLRIANGAKRESQLFSTTDGQATWGVVGCLHLSSEQGERTMGKHLGLTRGAQTCACVHGGCSGWTRGKSTSYYIYAQQTGALLFLALSLLLRTLSSSPEPLLTPPPNKSPPSYHV